MDDRTNGRHERHRIPLFGGQHLEVQFEAVAELFYLTWRPINPAERAITFALDLDSAAGLIDALILPLAELAEELADVLQAEFVRRVRAAGPLATIRADRVAGREARRAMAGGA